MLAQLFKEASREKELSPDSPAPVAEVESDLEPAVAMPELPSAPSTVLTPLSSKEEESVLALPSAPTAAPARVMAKPKSPLPQFTDEEIDSWCVICNDDATVRCRGCDGDLYCAKCWKDGHVGADAGMDERTHRWVKYLRR